MRIPAFILRCLIATVWTIFVVLAFRMFWVNIPNGQPWWGLIQHNFTVLQVIHFPLFQGILVFSFIYLIILFFSKKDSTIHLIALSFITLTIVFRILWVRYFDSQQISDFLTMWNLGHSIVANGIAGHSGDAVHFARSIFYTAPIQYLFGNNQQYLELVNVFLVTITMLIFYDFGRRVFSPKIAAGALLFFFWNPDIWYGVTLANHDIAFLPWLIGLCLIIYWIDKKLNDKLSISISVALLSVMVGLSIFVLEVQRSFGLPAWGALFLLLSYYLYRYYPRNPKNIVKQTDKNIRTFIIGNNLLKRSLLLILVFLIIPLSTYQLSKLVFSNVTGTWPEEDNLTYISAMDVTGTNRYKEMIPWRKEYSEQLPDDLRTEFSIRKFMSEVLSDPIETIRHYDRKNTVLADTSGILYFTISPAKDPWVGRINTKDVPMQSEVFHLLFAIIYFLLFLRLILHPFFPIKRGGFFLVFFTAILYLIMLLFTEAQPRYNLFTVFLTSLLVAQLLFGGRYLTVLRRGRQLLTSKSNNSGKEIIDENS